MRRFHHGHAVGIGVILGILLSQHVWLILLVGFVTGFVARKVYDAAHWTARTVEARLRPKPTGKIAARG